MALQKQNVPISFAGGLDTKTDPKQVVPGKLLTLENAIFTSLKRIKKRNGYKALSQIIEGGFASISAGSALSNYRQELLLLTGTKGYSYSASTMRWSDKGNALNLSLSSSAVIRNTFQQTTPDGAFHSSGLELFTWEDSRGGSRYSVIDSTTGETVAADVLINANAQKPKPFALGNYLLIMYYDSVTHHLRLLPLPVTSPSVPLPEIDLAINVNVAFPNYDASLSNTRLYFAYNNSSGGNAITVKDIDRFLTLSAARNILGESASSCISITIDQSNSQVWVAYHDGADVKYFVLTSFLSATPVLSPTTIEANANTISNITLYANGGSGSTYYTQHATLPSNTFIKTANLTNTGVVTGISVFLRSVGISSKPFAYNGVVYIGVAFDSVLQPTYFIINTSDKSVVAKFSPTSGGGILTKNIVPESDSIGNGSFLITSLEKDLFTTISGASYTQTGVNSTVINFNNPTAFDKVQLGENLHITGGKLYMYDGANIVEHGFNIFPENVTAVTATGSGSIDAGTYQYSVVYEWMDNQGQTHYSAPSVPITQVTTTASSTNTITIPTLRLTDKALTYRAPVIISVYRTEGENPGTIFYRVSSVITPLLNDTSVDTVTFVDTQSDATIIGNPTLYTTGGVVENIAAPAASFVTTYKDRVILLPEEDPNQFWYSKQVVPGVPVEFSDLFVENMDEAGGPLVAAARLDSVLILFKETLLYYLTGTGPDNTGAQNDFSDPQPIACDGGCIDKRSVILTPAGLMYKSQKGIYLLDRSFSAHYIGADVEAFNDSNILSVNLIENTQQVRFCLDNGTALVYDYYMSQWAVFTNHKAVDSVIFQDQFCYLTIGGQVLQETPGQFTDNGEFIKLRLVTAWLSFAGLQAFQRVYKLLLLGEYNTPHNLTVSASYDFNPYSTQAAVITAGALLQTGVYGSDATYGDTTPYGGAFPLYQFVVELARQKCETIQIAIEDNQTNSSFGESCSLSSLEFEVGLKKGTNKMSPANSFT